MPSLRFTVEFFRGDEARGFLMPYISVSQGISIIIFIAALAGMIVLNETGKAILVLQLFGACHRKGSCAHIPALLIRGVAVFGQPSWIPNSRKNGPWQLSFLWGYAQRQ